MVYFLVFIGIVFLFLGLPVSVIVTVVSAYRKKKVLIPAVCIPFTAFLGIAFIVSGGIVYGQTDEYKRSVVEKEQSELEQLKDEIRNQESYIKDLESKLNSNEKEEGNALEIVEPSDSQSSSSNLNNDGKEETEAETETATETEMEIQELTEEEYKELCEELFYDDVFFGEDDLEGKYVKLHLFLTEKYYFTTDDMHSDIFKSYNEKYDICRDFFKTSVLREGENSYVGAGKVSLWFSNDFDINPNEYKTGDHVIVYAEVISWSNNTWDGYNSVAIIPKYIEGEE